MKSLTKAEQELEAMLKNCTTEEYAINRTREIFLGICNEIVLQSYIQHARKKVRKNLKDKHA